MTRTMTQNQDMTVWMNENTFMRFWKEADSLVFECADGRKFRTFEDAEKHAAKE